MLPNWNFEFYENSTKFFKWVEKTGGKGETAHYELFLLFPQYFQKTSTLDTEKPGLVWERVRQHCIICKCFQFRYSKIQLYVNPLPDDKL